MKPIPPTPPPPPGKFPTHSRRTAQTRNRVVSERHELHQFSRTHILMVSPQSCFLSVLSAKSAVKPFGLAPECARPRAQHRRKFGLRGSGVAAPADGRAPPRLRLRRACALGISVVNSSMDFFKGIQRNSKEFKANE